MINIYGVKGGQGTTVIGAACAVHNARATAGETSVLVGDDEELNDLRMALGGGELDEGQLIFTIAEDRWILAQTVETAMQVDKSNHDFSIGRGAMSGAFNVLVIRSDYMALARAVRHRDRTGITPDRALFVSAPSLTYFTVLDAQRILLLDRQQVLELDDDPTIARCVDAGMLGVRPHPKLLAVAEALTRRMA